MRFGSLRARHPPCIETVAATIDLDGADFLCFGRYGVGAAFIRTFRALDPLDVSAHVGGRGKVDPPLFP